VPARVRARRLRPWHGWPRSAAASWPPAPLASARRKPHPEGKLRGHEKPHPEGKLRGHEKPHPEGKLRGWESACERIAAHLEAREGKGRSAEAMARQAERRGCNSE
jgi:hypothetical protein